MRSEISQTFDDPEMPLLNEVLSPRELSKHLNRVLPDVWGEVCVIRIQPLLYHPRRRCTVDVALQTETGSHELIAKAYATDRSDVYRAMEEISRSGFGPEDEFSIPKPLAFIPELHLLLQEKVGGPPATEIFLTGDESERAKAAETCAKWLVRFQMKAPMSGPVLLFTNEHLQRWLRRIVKNAGQLTDKAHLLFERLEIAASVLDNTETSACHGSYCDKQIILTESRTVAFDWDNHCVADPCRDVARFVFSLERSALQFLNSLRALDSTIGVFKKTYMEGSSFEVAKQLPFYKAAHCLKLGRFRMEPGKRGIEMAEALLDEGLRVLAEEM